MIRQQVLQRDGYCCVSCGIRLKSVDADVHHLLPRSMGGTDEMSNLVTLCDGCHARHHPNLAGGLARRAIERWAVRLARWLDREGVVTEAAGNFGPALRLFGLERFRHGQLPIIMAALSGKSVLVVSPTGSGKTLCFQLPAVLRRGVALVVSPLKALMAEQVSDLLAKKIPATFINSDLSRVEKETRFSLLSQRAIKLLYVAPERFFVRSDAERNQLKRSEPSFLIIDEAHCVDRWGEDFRPEYGRLREVREKLGAPPVLAFTATAGKEMQDRILASLGIPDAKVFVRDVDRPNIAMLRWHCRSEQRAQEIASMLALPQLKGQKAMIFVPTVKVGDELRTALSAMGLDIPFYHSKLGTAWERQELVKRFLGQSRPVVDQIVCTNAFGMGLDVPNVRLVVHWQQSASVEDLLQEFGRAGRDGKPSVSVMFHDGKGRGDTGRLKFMAEMTVSNAPGDEHQRAVMLEQRTRNIDQVAGMLRSTSCFRKSIRNYFGDSEKRHNLSLAERILEWVFGTRAPRTHHTACCDSCDAELIKKHGAAAYLAWVLGGEIPRTGRGQGGRDGNHRMDN
ncbi:RecQ family ATP-dependent DNA helicase [Mesorhizobium caraganae]|uniref:RecQ family ATP-dependent DNA helicase n=1 Tax=Mesorhizobium caraganae TaxID=483206 RepID=UPI00193AB075|nr:RecQ family ATP-dependent DNA helicase [Mesorhizobium caraganae]MBM2711040.1 RecQ family ATP-dependent DNA helicase [Mesorhizobium caraganae]